MEDDMHGTNGAHGREEKSTYRSGRKASSKETTFKN